MQKEQQWMEERFRIEFERDHETAKEIYQYLFFKRPLNLVLNIIMAFLFVFNLVVGFVTGNWDGSLYLVVIAAFFAYQIYMCQRAIKTMVKQEKDINNGNYISVVMTVEEEGFIQETSTGKQSTQLYIDIKQAVRTKKLILIQSSDNLLYTLKKEGFTKGTAEEFIAFLKEKGVKVK